ncbi:MAG: hypothetical protein ABWZ67_16610, partial [Solirubrobacteraceae bacterium]
GVRYPWTSAPILALVGLAFAIGAGFVIAAIAVAVVVLRSPAPPAEERHGALEPAYREAA